MSALNPKITPIVNRRRSQRILLSIAVRTSTTNENGGIMAEDTKTEVVNSDGGMVVLKFPVKQGQRPKIKNLNTAEEVTCVVVVVASGQHDTKEVGIEFEQPNSRFWRVSFPPQDWNSRSPEAKRFSKDGLGGVAAGPVEKTK